MVGGGSQRLHGEFWGKGWQKPFSRSHASRARPAGRITNDMDAEFKLHPAESFVNKKACVGFPRFLEPVFLKKGKNVDKLYPSSKACLKTGVPESMRV